ncbi:putative PMR5 domain, PC-Esterase, protein trichome birefringence-like 3 [Dioscorea sansibarensis]
MKLSKGKLPLSLMAIIISAVALSGVIFTEDLRFLTEEKESSIKKDEMIDEDKIGFNPSECRVMDGQWVFNSSMEPPYTEVTCPYIEKQVACQGHGRKDKDFLHWEWQLDDCTLPRFNARVVLEKLRGKRMMFVGDSLQRGQWLSFVCMLQAGIPEDQKFMNRSTRSLAIFGAKEYNATVEFYWAPYLVESNSDLPIITDTTKRILHVDSIAKHARNWVGVDILVFNTYVWWMTGHKLKSVWGSFSNGDDGNEELDTVFAYRLGLKTWANWVDSNIDPNLTRVFFITMSPAHMRSADWHNEKGIKCYNETKPVMKRGHWGSGSNKQMMEVVSNIIEKMRVPVTIVNITQLSEYRIDGHVSVYTETGGQKLTRKQKANPKSYADCIHWCLPGVPDTWNQVLYAYL